MEKRQDVRMGFRITRHTQQTAKYDIRTQAVVSPSRIALHAWWWQEYDNAEKDRAKVLETKCSLTEECLEHLLTSVRQTTIND